MPVMSVQRALFGCLLAFWCFLPVFGLESMFRAVTGYESKQWQKLARNWVLESLTLWLTLFSYKFASAWPKAQKSQRSQELDSIPMVWAWASLPPWQRISKQGGEYPEASSLRTCSTRARKHEYVWPCTQGNSITTPFHKSVIGSGRWWTICREILLSILNLHLFAVLCPSFAKKQSVSIGELTDVSYFFVKPLFLQAASVALKPSDFRRFISTRLLFQMFVGTCWHSFVHRKVPRRLALCEKNIDRIYK